jgi:hypothetical protein
MTLPSIKKGAGFPAPFCRWIGNELLGGFGSRRAARAGAAGLGCFLAFATNADAQRRRQDRRVEAFTLVRRDRLGLTARTAAAWRFAIGLRRSGGGFRTLLAFVAVIGGIAIARVIAVHAIAAILARFALLTVPAILTVAPAIFALLTLAVLATIIARLLLAAGLLGVGGNLVAVLIEAFILVVERILAATALVLVGVLLLEAAAAFGEDAEIMIRELQIIFGVDAIALALRIGGERLVFFQQLAGVATGAIVDPVARIGVAPTLALSTPTATAAGLTIIIDQSPVVLVSQTKPGLAPNRGQTHASNGC